MASDTASVEGFTLGSLKMVNLSERQALQFAQVAGKRMSDELLASLTGGNVSGLELIARKCVFVAWQNLVDMRRWNAFVHASSSSNLVEKEYGLFFGEGSNQRFPHTATLNNCTLAIIKPHILREGKTGKVLKAIQDAGFRVSAAESSYPDRPAADEFLEVYQGILADIEYNATTMELTSCRLLALELTQANNGSSKTDTDVITVLEFVWTVSSSHC